MIQDVYLLPFLFNERCNQQDKNISSNNQSVIRGNDRQQQIHRVLQLSLLTTVTLSKNNRVIRFQRKNTRSAESWNPSIPDRETRIGNVQGNISVPGNFIEALTKMLLVGGQDVESGKLNVVRMPFHIPKNDEGYSVAEI